MTCRVLIETISEIEAGKVVAFNVPNVASTTTVPQSPSLDHRLALFIIFFGPDLRVLSNGF
jgi:hypothetical protein